MFEFPSPFDELFKTIRESNQRLIESATQPIRDHINRLAQPPDLKMTNLVSEELLDTVRQSNQRLIESATQGIRDHLDKLAQPPEFKIPIPEITLPRFDLPNIAEAIIRESTRGIEEALNRFNPILARAAAVMARHGWWLVRQLPLVFYCEVANGTEVTRAEITDYIVDYFSHNEWESLTEMVNRWNLDGFSSRRRHFQDALEVHKQGRYTMSVPGLVIHVEGIVREFIQATDNFTDRSFAPVREHFQDKFESLGAIPDDRPITHDDLQLIENYYNLAVLERLYDNYRPENGRAPESVNRHAIGHGLGNNYATAEASLYLFLLLDMIHAMLEQISREDELRELTT